MVQTLEPVAAPEILTKPGLDAEPDLQMAEPRLNRKPIESKAPKKLLARYESFLIPLLVLFLVGNALAFALPNLVFARLEIGISLCLIFIGMMIYSTGKIEGQWAIRLHFWLIALVAGTMHYHYRHFSPPGTDISALAPLHRAEVMGVVTTQTTKNRVLLQVSQVNRQKVTGLIQATLPATDANRGIEAGTRVLIDGELNLPFHSVIPGAFDQAAYLNSQHITAILRKPSRMIAFETSNQPQYELQRLTDHFKQKISNAFAKVLPSPQSEILGGIVLGDKAIPVDRETKQAFIQTGLIHVLAASGMNVSIIAGAIFWLLALLKVPYRARIGIAMGAVAFYSLMTGLPPSIQRASAMLELALCLKLLNRQLNSVFLLCLAGVLLVAFNPENIASIGFQFSLLTTFGLLTMVPPLQEAIGYYTTRWLAGLVLVPLIAQLWVWPLSVAYFNQFPVHTVPLNIGALLLVGPLTLIGFVSGVLSLISAPLGGWVAGLSLPFVNALLAWVQWGNQLSWAQWTLPSPEAWQVLALYTALFATVIVLHPLKRLPVRHKLLVGLLPLGMLLTGTALEALQVRTHTQLGLLPLSHRHEAFLIQPAKANASLLVAPENLSYFEARALGDYLRHTHLTRLAGVVLLPEVGAESTTSSLKTAFKNTRIQTLIAANTTDLPLGLTVEQSSSFPQQGGRIQLGSLQLQGTLKQFTVQDSQFCLLAVQSGFQPVAGNQGCGVQVVQTGSEVRLFSQAKLKPERYYRLVQDGATLKVY